MRERRWCWWCGVGGSKRGNPRRNQKQQICFFLPPRSKPAQGQRLLSPPPRYLKEDVFTNRPLTVSRRANQGRVCASFFFLFFSSQAGDAHCPGASFIRGKHRHSAVGATRHAASCREASGFDLHTVTKRSSHVSRRVGLKPRVKLAL